MAPNPALGFHSTSTNVFFQMTTVTQEGTTITMAVNTSVPTSGSGGGQSNGLYLYTFMITLLILFGVSCGIIFRSCYLRRRFRNRMQAAIDTGVVLPPAVLAQVTGKNQASVGEKPVMYDIYLDESEVMLEKAWQPVSATVVPPKGASTEIDSPDQPVRLTRELASQYFGVDMRSLPELARDFWGNSSANRQLMWESLTGQVARRRERQRNTGNVGEGATGDAPTSSEATTDEGSSSPKKVALGIVIAMPDPSKPIYATTPRETPMILKSDSEEDVVLYSQSDLKRGKMPALKSDEDDEQELPELVFGVLEVDWKSSAVPPPKTS